MGRDSGEAARHLGRKPDARESVGQRSNPRMNGRMNSARPARYTQRVQALGGLLEPLRTYCSQAGVDLCVLFGSHATGRARPGSDIDVAFLLSDDSPAARRRAEIDLQRAMGGNADVTFLADAPPPVAVRDRAVWHPGV